MHLGLQKIDMLLETRFLSISLMENEEVDDSSITYSQRTVCMGTGEGINNLHPRKLFFNNLDGLCMHVRIHSHDN